MEDKELIYKIQHGNKELLEILIEKYYDDIYRFCYYKTGNSSLSYDLTQETFLKLIKYIGTYKHRGKFKSYLITIAMNVCNTYFDENKVELEELDDNQTYKENNSNALSRIEQKNSIDKALKELSEQYKKFAKANGMFLSGGTDSHEKQVFSREPKIKKDLLENKILQ